MLSRGKLRRGKLSRQRGVCGAGRSVWRVLPLASRPAGVRIGLRATGPHIAPPGDGARLLLLLLLPGGSGRLGRSWSGGWALAAEADVSAEAAAGGGTAASTGPMSAMAGGIVVVPRLSIATAVGSASNGGKCFWVRDCGPHGAP